jgi:hypothetical protein
MQITIKKQKPFAELLPHPRGQGCALGIVYDGGKAYGALYILVDDNTIEETEGVLGPYNGELDITPKTVLRDYRNDPEGFKPLEN